jgi:hypothetical protein
VQAIVQAYHKAEGSGRRQADRRVEEELADDRQK